MFRHIYHKSDHLDMITRYQKLGKCIPADPKFHCLSQFLSHPNPCNVESLAFCTIKYRHTWLRHEGRQRLLPTDSVLMLLFYQPNSFKDVCNVIYAPFLNLSCQKTMYKLVSKGTKGNDSFNEKEMHTRNVSAALFKSRMPSSACLSKLMNFLVNSPEQTSQKEMSGKE